MFGWLKYVLGGTPKTSERSELYQQWAREGELPSETAPEGVSGSPTEKSLGEREDRLRALESVAEVEETRNVELEERLEFKKKEEEVLVRVRKARARKGRLRELLGEYGTPRSLWSTRSLVVLGAIGGFVLLLTLFGSC